MSLNLGELEMKLFGIIGIAGTCTFDQAQKIYNWHNNKYHYTRVERLIENGYLIKRGRFLELTNKSAGLIGIKKYRFRHNDERQIHSVTVDLIIEMPEATILSNRELREKHAQNRKTHFRGGIVIDGQEYFFYILPNDPSTQLISFIRAELRSLSALGICKHAIVFCPSPKAMEIDINDAKQVELWKIPYPFGVRILKSYLKDANQEYLASIMPGAKKTKMPYAHYEAPGCYYTILIMNDLAKREILSSYYQTPSQKLPVIIICLESQKEMFAENYPQAKIRAISDEKFYEM